MFQKSFQVFKTFQNPSIDNNFFSFHKFSFSMSNVQMVPSQNRILILMIKRIIWLGIHVYDTFWPMVFKRAFDHENYEL